MNKKDKALEAMLTQKLLPLYFHESAEVSEAVLKALYAAGTRVVEYTDRGENALENFKVLRKEVERTMPGLVLGIGTIKTQRQAQKFVEAGADFIVCPCFHEAVAAIAREAGILWIPGCLTTTEIAQAEEAGASLVKIFPGSLVGPSYFTAIREIFPKLKFMPTGGVEVERTNLKDWFEVGAAVVGIGSKLISREIMDQKDYDRLQAAAFQALELVKEAAGNH